MKKSMLVKKNIQGLGKGDTMYFRVTPISTLLVGLNVRILMTEVQRFQKSGLPGFYL